MNESSPSPDIIGMRTRSTLIEITCPSWCRISIDEHALRLWNNEGRCVHEKLVTVADPRGKLRWGEATAYNAPIELVLHLTTDPAGREVESADVLINGQETNLEQLARLAAAIVDLGALYRATPGRRNGP